MIDLLIIFRLYFRLTDSLSSAERMMERQEAIRYFLRDI